jgi:hypothetical protein
MEEDDGVPLGTPIGEKTVADVSQYHETFTGSKDLQGRSFIQGPGEKGRNILTVDIAAKD